MQVVEVSELKQKQSTGKSSSGDSARKIRNFESMIEQSASQNLAGKTPADLNRNSEVVETGPDALLKQLLSDLDNISVKNKNPDETISPEENCLFRNFLQGQQNSSSDPIHIISTYRSNDPQKEDQFILSSDLVELRNELVKPGMDDSSFREGGPGVGPVPLIKENTGKFEKDDEDIMVTDIETPLSNSVPSEKDQNENADLVSVFGTIPETVSRPEMTSQTASETKDGKSVVRLTENDGSVPLIKTGENKDLHMKENPHFSGEKNGKGNKPQIFSTPSEQDIKHIKNDQGLPAGKAIYNVNEDHDLSSVKQFFDKKTSDPEPIDIKQGKGSDLFPGNIDPAEMQKKESVINLNGNFPEEGSRIQTLSRGLANVIQVIRNDKGNKKGIVRVDPPELGKVNISVESMEDRIHVHLTVEKPEAVDLIRGSEDLLRESLKKQGLSMGDLSVDVGGDDRDGYSRNRGYQDHTAAFSGPDLDGFEEEIPLLARIDLGSGMLHWIA